MVAIRESVVMSKGLLFVFLLLFRCELLQPPAVFDRSQCAKDLNSMPRGSLLRTQSRITCRKLPPYNSRVRRQKPVPRSMHDGHTASSLATPRSLAGALCQSQFGCQRVCFLF